MIVAFAGSLVKYMPNVVVPVSVMKTSFGWMKAAIWGHIHACVTSCNEDSLLALGTGADGMAVLKIVTADKCDGRLASIGLRYVFSNRFPLTFTSCQYVQAYVAA
jgi:hypothetical protein